MNPKVFISHASEDKDRFVVELSKKLRNSGIDAWLDKWEMHPGDSLVDKIFEEGIKESEAMIVVISKISIKKKWVREELNAGVIKRINNNSKLIPVIIDDCEVPEVLKTLVWIKIQNLSNYNDEFDRIKSAILSKSNKPTLGHLVKYATISSSSISGYTNEDTIIIKIACELALNKNNSFIDVDEIYTKAEEQFEMSKEIASESTEVLVNGLIFNGKSTNKGLAFITVTIYGFEMYAEQFIENYDELKLKIASNIVNSDHQVSNTSIYKETNIHKYIINHVLDSFDGQYINQIKTGGNRRIIIKILPELKRMIREI